MKAWGVTDREEGYGVIVFADTRSRARTLGHTSAGLDEQEWIDVDVRRCPSADGKSEVECIADWQKDCRIYYEAGWFADEARRSCDDCSRFYYPQIPESWIDDEMGICKACSDSPHDSTIERD